MKNDDNDVDEGVWVFLLLIVIGIFGIGFFVGYKYSPAVFPSMTDKQRKCELAGGVFDIYQGVNGVILSCKTRIEDIPL